MTTIALPRPRNPLLDRLRTIQIGIGARGAVGVGLATQRGGAAVASNGLLNSLVAYWPLNEAAGANDALDAHSNGLTLTQTASPGSAAGKVYAGARTFNGSSQYFNRASQALLQTGNVDFSIAAWVYMTSAGAANQVIAGKDNSAIAREWYLYHSVISGKLRLLIYPGASVVVDANTFGATPLNQWILVIAAHSALTKTISIQCNDVPADIASYASGELSASSVPFALATYSSFTGSSFWPGRIGPVAFWKSAAGGGGVLTSEQRAALWNEGAGLAYSEFAA